MEAGRTVTRGACITLVLLFSGSRSASADECLPVSGPSLEIVAERYSLEPEQLAWLRARLAAGALDDPSSLDDLPGAGPDLRHMLETSFCWSAPARVRVQAGLRWREGNDAARSSFTGEKAPWAILASFYREPSRNASLARGGAWFRAKRWSVAVGTIENREGLGLSIQTAGTELRGSAPRRRAVLGWTPTATLDDGVQSGVFLGFHPGSWSLSIGGLRPTHGREPGCWVLSMGRSVKTGGFSGHVGGSSLNRIGSVTLWRTLDAGDWSLEAAQGGEGSALGSAFGLRLGSWKLRGSLVWTGAGYASPLMSGREDPREDNALAGAAEARWSGGRGRFIRVLRAMNRRASAYVDTPPTCAMATELEWVEPLRPGLEVAFLWRLRRSYPDGSPSITERSQEGQGEVRWSRRGFSARARFQERLDVAGSQAWQVSVGRLRDWMSWEIRAAHGVREPGANTLPFYVRRAQSWSGNGSLTGDAVIGIWARCHAGAWSLEASGDGGGDEWTWTCALERRWGGPS